MQTYLVSYDLDKPGQDYTDLINRLKQMGAKKVLFSEWIVRSDDSAKEIRDDLLTWMDDNDRILVIALTGESAWNNLMISDQAFKQSMAA